MPTPLRRFRCPDDLWVQVSTKAQAEGTNVTEVIVSHLRRYVTGSAPPFPDHPDHPDKAARRRQARPMRETVRTTEHKGPLRSNRQDCPAEGFTPQKPGSPRCVCGLTQKHHIYGGGAT